MKDRDFPGSPYEALFASSGTDEKATPSNPGRRTGRYRAPAETHSLRAEPEVNFTEAPERGPGKHCPMEGWRDHVGRTAAWQGIAKGSVMQTDNSTCVS